MTLLVPHHTTSPLSRSAIRTAAAIVTVALCTLIIRQTIKWDPIGGQDEGILLVYPDLILRGYRPYLDFAPLYSPGGFYLIAGLFKVFGLNVTVERGVGLLYWSLVMIALLLVGSRIERTTGILAVITALAYSTLYQSPGAHPHFGALACMLFALFFASSNTTSNASLAKVAAPLAGVLAGLAVWIKQDLGLVAVLASFGSFSLGGFDGQKLCQLRRFLLGVSIPVCGLIIFALIVGPSSVIDGLILDPLRSAPGRFIPIKMSLYLVVVIVCLIVQLHGAAIVRSSTIPEHLVRLSRGIAAASVLFALSLLHNFNEDDISWVGTIVVSLTVVTVRITLAHLKVEPHREIVVMASCLLIGLLPAFIRYFTMPLGLIDASWVVSRGRTLPVSMDSSLKGLLDDINRLSSPGDRLFVGPRDLRFANSNDTYIYYLLPQLVPATRYLEMNPGCANRLDSGLVDQIRKADWLILVRDQGFDPVKTSSSPGPSAPNDVVQNNFCVLSEYTPWVLLHRCGRKLPSTT